MSHARRDLEALIHRHATDAAAAEEPAMGSAEEPAQTPTAAWLASLEEERAATAAARSREAELAAQREAEEAAAEQVAAASAREQPAGAADASGDGGDDDSNTPTEAAPALSAAEEEAEEQLLQRARAEKERGNGLFAASEYEEALLAYSEAVDLAESLHPPRAAERAIFLANRAACHAKLGEHAQVVSDCTAALELRPEYVKALVRRGTAREALEEYHDACEDMKAAVALDPKAKVAANAVPRLEAAAAAKLEAQKEEMIGKLKDLGNSVLGRFGMSLDNFKADKDPETGSYNISFSR